MLTADSNSLYAALLSAGAILTGFCGSFLSFRIQREANYYRQPAVDLKTNKGGDVYIGLSHFTSSFLVLIAATLLAVIFGFILPLLALIGMLIQPAIVVAGMVASVICVIGYFTCEMVHYGVLNRRLLNDPHEWGRLWGIVIITFLLAVLSVVLILTNSP